MLDERTTATDALAAGGPRWLDRCVAWCGRRERTLLVAIVLGQLLVLVAVATLHAAPLVFGQTVVLDTLPVDPRDPFRGDYVILRYAFTDEAGLNGAVGLPSPASTPSPFAWQEDQPAYVALTSLPDGSWQTGPATPLPPATRPYLAGRHTGGRFLFGIEAYYVQEGQGIEWEKVNRAGDLQAELAVAPWGQATLRGLKRKS
jgi:uncharacterized membrane-anchored protein